MQKIYELWRNVCEILGARKNSWNTNVKYIEKHTKDEQKIYKFSQKRNKNKTLTCAWKFLKTKKK